MAKKIYLFLLTRPLRDVTPTATDTKSRRRAFLLTRPLRDVTVNAYNNILGTVISTHTPLAGRDAETAAKTANEAISTHTPLAGRDQFGWWKTADEFHFYSHAPCGT